MARPMRITHTTPGGEHSPENCPGGGPWPCVKPGRQAVRSGALDPVDRLVSVLVGNGLTVEEACKAIRWAAHVIEGKEVKRERENVAATGMHYDDPELSREGPCVTSGGSVDSGQAESF